MPLSSRANWALGLCLGVLGVAGLVSQSVGKQDTADSRGAGANAPAPAPAATARIGTIDTAKVISEYKKAKFLHDQLQKAALERQGELQRIASQMEEVMKQTEGLDRNGNDYKNAESKYVTLKAELQAKKEQAQAEFERRRADALSTIYKDVHDMTAAVAKHRGFNYVMRANNEPLSGADPEMVLAALERPVVFSDPANDVTEMVLKYLNMNYDKATAAPGSAKPADQEPPASTQGAAAAQSAVPKTAAGRAGTPTTKRR